MITHHQAEMLISARQDRPLDAAEQRELAAHLATCARCRAFARQVGMIRDDLHNLPVLPPSMTVTRGVLEHVNAGRSPWARFLNLFGAQPLPAFATVAATLVIVALLGTLVFNRLLEGPERTPALLTAPTAQALATKQQATRNSIAPTPTATVPPPPTALPPLPNITVSLTPVPPTATPSPASTPGETPSATAAPAGDLSAAAKTGTAANPGGMLVLNGDAIQTADPAGIDLASLDTPAGSSLSTTQGKQGQAVRYCNATNACRDLSSASASGAHTDTPIGWLGTYAIYERVTPATGAVSYRAVTATGDDDHRLLTGDEGIAVRDVVIDLGDRLLIAGRGSWVLLTSDSGRVVGANPYGALAQVRAYENITPQKIGFVAGGTVFVVPIERPDAPAFQIQAHAVGYDLSPDGSQLAVSDGATITVYRADGAVVGQFANGGGISIGSVLWLRQGIEYIDRTNGVIRQVDPAALS